MARYLLKRLAMMLLTLLIVVTLTFFLMKLIPGSPLGNVMKLNHAQQAAVEKQYGLNQPVWRQYLTYLARSTATLGCPISIPERQWPV